TPPTSTSTRPASSRRDPTPPAGSSRTGASRSPEPSRYAERPGPDGPGLSGGTGQSAHGWAVVLAASVVPASVDGATGVLVSVLAVSSTVVVSVLAVSSTVVVSAGGATASVSTRAPSVLTSADPSGS